MIRDGSSVGLAILVNFVVCILCGFLNGVIIFDLKVPAMIATLGTSTIYRGILKRCVPVTPFPSSMMTA